MRGFGWAMAIVFALNIVAALVSVATGWDAEDVARYLYGAVVCYFCLEYLS